MLPIATASVRLASFESRKARAQRSPLRDLVVVQRDHVNDGAFEVLLPRGFLEGSAAARGDQDPRVCFLFGGNPLWLQREPKRGCLGHFGGVPYIETKPVTSMTTTITSAMVIIITVPSGLLLGLGHV